MSSSESSSESSYDSEDSQPNFAEVEDEQSERELQVSCESSDDMAYADEPLADDEWLKTYEKEEEENKQLEKKLQARLDGTVQVDSWCSCGNCSRVALQNLSECYCCQELDGCKEAMCSESVIQDIQSETVLNCITQHPGFDPVCLQKWSLRLAGERVKTKAKQRYRQTGPEESYLRSIAYREFCRLVYGFMGNKRIPLPACAYTAIRKQFPVGTNETYTGFELDEDD